jgi:hypothetical protein
MASNELTAVGLYILIEVVMRVARYKNFSFSMRSILNYDLEADVIREGMINLKR